MRTRGSALRGLFAVMAAIALLTSACSGGGDDDGDEVSAGAGGDSAGDGKFVDDENRRLLTEGTNGPTTAGQITANSPDDWRGKWVATGVEGPPPDVNDVDFTKEVVVALLAGERPTGGWKISPDVVVKRQGRFAAIEYTVVGPGKGCSTSQALTAPYLVLAVRADAVRFTAKETTEDCED
jgi:hypothetical protein